MKEEIADDIELLVQHALENFDTKTNLYKAARRIEAYLATYSTDNN